MGIEIIHDPVPPLDLGESARDVTHVGREVLAGPGRSQVADDFAGGHDERGRSRRVSRGGCNRARVAGLAGLSRLRGMGTAQRLHPRLLITADQQPTALVHRGCLDIQLADRPSLGVEVGIVAVEPVDAAVRFQVGLVQSPPDRRPAHGPVMSGPIDQGGGQVIERPAGGRATLLFGRAAGQGDHIEPLRGGKSSAAGRTAEHPEGQPSPVEIAVPPKRDGVAIAVELGGDLKVGGLVRVGGSEDQPASEDQGLRRGTGSNQAPSRAR